MEEPKIEEPNKERQIDKLVEESDSWLKRKYIFIEKKKVKTWQAIFIIAFCAGIASAFIWGVSEDIFSNSKAAEGAVLTLDPADDVSALTIGQEFNLDIVLNTNTNNVVAAKAVVNYDPAKFELVSWNTDDSSFAVDNSCVYQNKPCEIVNNDTGAGKITITVAKPSPGVNSDSATIGTLKFKGKALISNPTADNISLAFISAGNYDDSDVIVDDGQGTDILRQAINVRLSVYAETCTDFTYSDWSVCSPDGKQTRTIATQGPAGCAGGQPILQQSCTPPSCESTNSCPTCENFTYSDWSGCSSQGKQTRTVTAQTPSDCTGGNPILEQSCTPESTGSITCETFTYSDWGDCEDGKQTRDVATSSPAGCVGGNPDLSEKCDDGQSNATKPKFTDLPFFLNKHKGDKVWWKVQYPKKIEKYEITLGGYHTTVHKGAFIIPANTKSGLHILKVKAINKSGSNDVRRVMIRVR